MPTYEYRCEKCGELFEVRQKFVDQPLTTHDNCGGHVNRLLSAPALMFKGSGFYITDYAKGSNPGSKPPSNGDKAKSDSSGKAEVSSKTGGSGKTDSSSATTSSSSEKSSSSSSSDPVSKN